jgi:hypothetical protein
MPFCSNPDCPHKVRTGSFAEYQDDVTLCPECNSPLTNSSVEPVGYKKKIESDLKNKIFITIGLLALFRIF